MKKLVLFICTLMIIISILGCEPYTARVIITKYPDRLIYIAGYDTALDLTGGEIKFFMSDRTTEVLLMKDLVNSVRLSHEIDFDASGVYVVRITNHNGKGDSFAIQVVEADYIDNIISQKLEFE